MRASDPPPLHQLHEDVFEELCRDLIAAEPNIANCNRYGTRGERQHGIDLLAEVRNSSEHHVAQCKCYESFPRDKIRAASDEFLKHLTYWQEYQVKRFVLIVAEPLEKVGQREQIIVEQRRFATIGIRYEVWSLTQIIQHLKPWRQLVERYIDQGRAEFWADRICGPVSPVTTSLPKRQKQANVSGPSLEPEFSSLIALATEGISAKLDACRAAARKGLLAEAETQLAALLSDSSIADRMSPSLRAKSLRLQASLALDRSEGMVRAKLFLAEANQLDSSPTTNLQARIVLSEQGPQSCIEFLAANGDGGEEDLSLRAVCHLQAGEPNQAISILEPIVAHATTADPERLFALALISTGRSEEACEFARRAAFREPEGWATRMTLPVVLYAAALSPLTSRGRIAGWPEPCDWNVVRRDDKSVSLFREAADLFEHLQTDRQERIDKETLQSYRLACLANDAECQSEAQAYCHDLLRQSPTNAAAISWAIARAFPTEGKHKVLDIATTTRALEDLVEQGRGDILHISVLAVLLSMRGKQNKIEPMLKRAQRRFTDIDSSLYLGALLEEAKLRSSHKVDDMSFLQTEQVKMLRAFQETDRAAARSQLLDIVIQQRDKGNISIAFADALFRLASLGFFEDISPFSDDLVRVVDTADAIALAAQAKAMSGDCAGAVSLLDTRISSFPGELLPRHLRVLRAQCNQRLGRLPVAISEMQALREDGADLNETLGLADMLVRQGDMALAAKTIAGIIDDPGITPQLALRLAHVFGNDDPMIATRLWRRAVAAEIDISSLPHAIAIARRLSLGAETEKLVQRMAMHAVQAGPELGGAPIVAVSMDQLRELLLARRAELEHFHDLHENGTVPFHLLAPQAGWSLVHMFHQVPLAREADPAIKGLLLAYHGGRSEIRNFPESPSDWRLHLDITAILIAHHLGILDTVERCFLRLHIPSQLVPALLTLRGELLDIDTAADAAAKKIIAAIDRGRLKTTKQTDADSPDELVLAFKQKAKDINGALLLWNEAAIATVQEDISVVNLSGFLENLLRLGAVTQEEDLVARGCLALLWHILLILVIFRIPESAFD